MFCPNCKAEYRTGFYECSDCHVPLVDSLPPDQTEPGDDVDSQAAEMLWSGYNAALQNQIGAALDAANIPYADQSREVNWLPALEQRAPYEIWIMRSDHDAAAKILADSFPDTVEADPSEVEELSDESDQPPAEATPEDLPLDFCPEDATCEVWSGDDDQTAQFLRDSLRGIGVACVVSSDDGKSHVFVLPAAETRAREIVREIIEGTPPQ